MKKHTLMILGAMLLMISISSCREESDKLMTYDHPDVMAFSKADTCFAEKFKILWNGLNQCSDVSAMAVEWQTWSETSAYLILSQQVQAYSSHALYSFGSG